MNINKSLLVIFFICLLFSPALSSETQENGNRYNQLVIRNAIIIDGNGTPPKGPVDVIIEGNTIQSIIFPGVNDDYKEADRVIGMFWKHYWMKHINKI